MISAWWILRVLVAGGSLGMLIMALMNVSGGLPEQRMNIDEVAVLPD